MSSVPGRQPACRRAICKAMSRLRITSRTAIRSSLVLLPATIQECYEFGMESFDIAERFQTPVFVLSDLDLGMNSWLTPPLPYPEKAFRSRQRCSAPTISNKMGSWGRYRGRRWRRHSVSHVAGTKTLRSGVLHARHRSRRGSALLRTTRSWKRGLDRLVRKHDTARAAMPQPVVDEANHPIGIIAFGTTHHAVFEARERLRADGVRNRLSPPACAARFRPRSPALSVATTASMSSNRTATGKSTRCCAASCRRT